MIGTKIKTRQTKQNLSTRKQQKCWCWRRSIIEYWVGKEQKMEWMTQFPKWASAWEKARQCAPTLHWLILRNLLQINALYPTQELLGNDTDPTVLCYLELYTKIHGAATTNYSPIWLSFLEGQNSTLSVLLHALCVSLNYYISTEIT